MICVYDVGENHYDRLGSCVLTPIKGSHRQIAGGSYELTLEHPIDEGGKWTHLQNGAILKVPVPEETIEDAREGMAADIYRTVSEAELREEPSEPQQINYNEWNPANSYTVGSKVTCSGWNHRNWQCTFYDETSPQTYVPPYNNNSWWKQIADYTSGSPVVVKLPAGETLYLIEAEGGWYLMMTPYGVQGYVRPEKVEFVKHVEPGEITSHVITEQLFRITEVDIDNEANKVTAKARHVSYDLNGILCEDMEISQASAAMAISRIAQGLMMDYPGAIATNLTDTAGTYTQSIKGRNGGFCLLDPDRGVLPAFGAMLKRDNWDIFVMKKKHPDRGYRIRYGKNAKGINWQRKVQDLVTRVVPVAKNEDGSNLYLPEKWVDSTHIGDYPTIIMEWLRVDGQVGKDDGTGTDTVWTAETLYTEMRTKAGERFSVDKVDIPAEEVTVNFEQLGDTAEYPWMRERETILLYDKIQAIDERIGLRMDLYVTEIEYDIIRQKVTGVKLSNTDSYRERTVTGFNVQDNSITPRKLTDEVKDSFMASAVGVMPNYANSNTWKPNTASTEGYVQKGEGNANKVWATNGSGEPGWRTPGGYTLPLAADGTRGGVQIGYTQSGKNYPVQLDGEKMYVNVPWSNTTYSAGTGLSLSGGAFSLKTGYTQSGKNYPVVTDSNGNPYVNVPWTDHYAWNDITGKPATATRWPSWDEVTGKPSSFYTLPLAGNGTRGGVQIGYTQSGKNYPVQLDGEKMYVNVPWTDTKAWDSITGKPATATRWPSWSEVTDKPGSFYTLPLAANGTRGGVQVGYTTSAENRNYAVQLSGEKMYVNVPWSDTNTWRPVEDSLVSTSTTNCLSANAGRVLQNNKLEKNTAGGIASCDGAGSNWYFKIATIKISSGYINRPILFEISQRGYVFHWLEVLFGSSGDADPGLNHFVSNGIRQYWIKKTATSTWEIYGKYSEVWGSATLHRITGSGANIGVTVNMVNIGTTEPTNATQATASWTSSTLFMPRVNENANSLPGANDVRVREYQIGNTGLPTSDAWYHIYEARSVDTNYATQLALGMTSDYAYYRKYSGGGFGSWKSLINTWRPISADLTATHANYALDQGAGYDLAHGYARDNRVLYLSLSPGAQKSIEIKSANGGYAVIWRLGKAGSHGVKFGSGDNCTNIILTGTDYLGVTYNMQTVTFKNNNSSYHVRAWVFYNGNPGMNLDPDD